MYRGDNAHHCAHPMIVVLYLWRTQKKDLPRAIWHMASDRTKLKRDQEIGFFKLLGTGTGQTFTPRDADPTLWGLLITIEESALKVFDHGTVITGWRKFADSEARFTATAISSHGKWSGVQPFTVNSDLAKSWNGKIMVLTRARIRWRKNIQFWRAVPPVIDSLRDCVGVESAIGIGEAPLGLQGTFSVWSGPEAVRNFAYKGAAHAEVIRKTQTQNWYSEELFARFALLEVRGSVTDDK